ncbi:MAG: HlyC/CorC family transporter [Mesorhizobium sp.]|nr:hemolysin family protein [Mesorhizobium sp.]MBL8579835.1 HlyC/CorC family transporter [Mesorhizobium sp.]
MNDSPVTAAPPEPGDAKAEKTEDGPSLSPGQSMPPAAATGTPASRSSFFDRLAGLFKQRNGANLREEIVDALAETEVAGEEAFSPGERAMLNNILRLREVRVEDVMIPRADIEAVEINTKLADLMNLFERSGHSRMPVYAETLDDPRGMVHIRDVLAHITRLARKSDEAQGAALDFAEVDTSKTIGELDLMRTVLFVPPSMLASDLMGRMQASRTQMALVIDEYGGTDGLASLEDIVEMVVGDIEDEHDDEQQTITQAGDGVYVVDGKAEIEDVEQALGESFKAGEHGEYVDTIGGLVFNALGRVPVRGEVVQAVPGFEFHVLEADPRRVKRVRIVDLSKAERRRRVS